MRVRMRVLVFVACAAAVGRGRLRRARLPGGLGGDASECECSLCGACLQQCCCWRRCVCAARCAHPSPVPRIVVPTVRRRGVHRKWWLVQLGAFQLHQEHGNGACARLWRSSAAAGAALLVAQVALTRACSVACACLCCLCGGTAASLTVVRLCVWCCRKRARWSTWTLVPLRPFATRHRSH